MVRLAYLAAAGAVGGNALSNVIGNQKGSMEPEEAAKFLVSADDDWQKEANLCSLAPAAQALCQTAPEKFTTSCNNVVSTLVQGGAGNQKMMFRRRLQQSRTEFFTAICGQVGFEGPHQKHCQSLASAVGSMVTDHVSESEVKQQIGSICKDLWNVMARDAALAQEQKEKDVVAKVRDEARAEMGDATSKVQEEAVEQSQLTATLKKLDEQRLAKEDAERKLAAKTAAVSDLKTKLNATQAELVAANRRFEEVTRAKTEEDGKQEAQAEKMAKLEAHLQDSEAKLKLAVAKEGSEAEAEQKAEDEAKTSEAAERKAKEETKAAEAATVKAENWIKEEAEKAKIAEDAEDAKVSTELKAQQAKLAAEELKMKAQVAKSLGLNAKTHAISPTNATKPALVSSKFRSLKRTQ